MQPKRDSLVLATVWAAVFMLSGMIVLAADSTINSTYKWAWSASAGWLNCRPTATNGVVIGQYNCSGWAYSPNCGWVHFGDGSPTNGQYYTNTSTNDYGVNHDGMGHLTGYAWCESTGWINFEWTNKEAADSPKISLTSGTLSGYAWGDSLGWIGLSNMSAWVTTTSLDPGVTGTNNIPDTWEIQMTGEADTLSNSGDYDEDGVSDYDEYISGTHPTNGADVLKVGNIGNSTGGAMQIQWDMAAGRTYMLETNSDLMNAGGWAQHGSDYLTTSTGNTCTVTFDTSSITSLYYRIRVKLPLTP